MANSSLAVDSADLAHLNNSLRIIERLPDRIQKIAEHVSLETTDNSNRLSVWSSNSKKLTEIEEDQLKIFVRQDATWSWNRISHIPWIAGRVSYLHSFDLDTISFDGKVLTVSWAFSSGSNDWEMKLEITPAAMLSIERRIAAKTKADSDLKDLKAT